MPSQKPQSRPQPSRHTQLPPEVVDPVWLLKALALCVIAALLCGYATLCLLFYQGSWQLILHPAHPVVRTPANAGLAYSDVRFDSIETGQPRLTAWWIPAAPQPGFASTRATPTILYLHDGSGSLANTLPTLTLLHAAGANIFAIDYRGFGLSDSSQHPSASRMAEDASAALDYLTQTRHIPPTAIVPYGAGLAASLAAHLARTHPALPAVILDNPIPDPAALAIAARPSRILPIRLLFGNQFDVASPLASLSTPKLLIAGGPTAFIGDPASMAGGPAPTAPGPNPAALQTFFTQAASPRVTVTLPPGAAQPYHNALTQFLDQYLPPN